MQESGYNTIKMENMQLTVAPKCVHIKGKNIWKKTELLDQPINACPTQLITQKVPHVKKVCFA